MSMKNLKLKVTGIAPLLMHDNKAANPLNSYAKALKSKTCKLKKTDQDYFDIARIEWEAGLYIHDGVVAIPARCIEKCFLLGARKSKLGKQYESGVFLDSDWSELSYRGSKIKASKSDLIPNDGLDKFFEEHSDIQMVKVGTNQVPRCRPTFVEWSFECTLMFDPTIIEEANLLNACQDAGRLIGLLEQRPRLGRFVVEKIK